MQTWWVWETSFQKYFNSQPGSIVSVWISLKSQFRKFESNNVYKTDLIWPLALLNNDVCFCRSHTSLIISTRKTLIKFKALMNQRCFEEENGHPETMLLKKSVQSLLRSITKSNEWTLYFLITGNNDTREVTTQNDKRCFSCSSGL